MKIRLFTLLLLPLSLAAQQYDDCILLWNGFSQSWGYNHRLHRLGDYVANPDTIGYTCTGTLAHAAASGSGADRAAFTQYFSSVMASDVTFQPGFVDLELEGREGDSLFVETVVTTRHPGAEDRRIAMEAVLNGFDLRTADGASADKVKEFSVEVGSVVRDAASFSVRFRIAAALTVDCASAECPWFDNSAQYRLRVHYVLLAGKGLSTTRTDAGSSAAWTKDSLPDTAATHLNILGEAGHPAAALAFRRIALHLDDAYHMQDWDAFIRPKAYDPVSGLFSFDLGLRFGQWGAAMREAFRERYAGKPKLPPKLATVKKKGNAYWEAAVILLQFSDGAAAHHRRSGTIDWKTRHARQRAASDTSAVNAETFFEF